eukprot:9425838-Ditylum_brightwellii.AAC.1
MQSGGFSPHIGRSFGLFHDHVVRFCIITSDLQPLVVTKPNPREPEKENDNLWMAVMGGSPGNFGVIVSLELKPLWDNVYPNVRAQVHYMIYTPAAWTEVMSFLAELNADNNLPADFNVYAITLGKNPRQTPTNMDTKMMGLFNKHEPKRPQGIGV